MRPSGWTVGWRSRERHIFHVLSPEPRPSSKPKVNGSTIFGYQSAEGLQRLASSRHVAPQHTNKVNPENQAPAPMPRSLARALTRCQLSQPNPRHASAAIHPHSAPLPSAALPPPRMLARSAPPPGVSRGLSSPHLTLSRTG
eukprot:scaffold18338_cov60-Phaeocystis_antarctica.AAC.3